ncbi:unannotated protein [freshwater metagenome]|uniref:Unannotated protein n=1 Tax=freshwater metagenome TaxID=449393 RepID=A0A6J7L2Z7_9ZZZZ
MLGVVGDVNVLATVVAPSVLSVCRTLGNGAVVLLTYATRLPFSAVVDRPDR